MHIIREKEHPMDAKHITVAVAGSGGKKEFQDVQLLPGTKARDVLARLNLHGFQISKPDGGAFAHNDDLFSAVAPGQKLFVAKSDVEAGRYAERPA